MSARVVLPLDLLTHDCNDLSETGRDAPEKSKSLQRLGIEVKNLCQCCDTPNKFLTHGQSLVIITLLSGPYTMFFKLRYITTISASSTGKTDKGSTALGGEHRFANLSYMRRSS